MPVQNTEWHRYHTSLPDGGAQYAETNPDNFIVEPWNALSSLVLLLPAIYWALRIRRTVRDNPFIAWCIPLLTLGGLGSTLFHAFRSSPVLLWMDVLPMLVLTLSVSAYFWQKVVRNRLITMLILITAVFLRVFTVKSGYFPSHTASNISYAISGIAIFLPALLLVFRSNFYRLGTLVLSIGLFVVSLLFREIDARSLGLFSMGTHFLWHICSAGGAFFLAAYLYALEKAGENTMQTVEAIQPSKASAIARLFRRRSLS